MYVVRHTSLPSDVCGELYSSAVNKENKNLGRRRFRYAGPSLWNALSDVAVLGMLVHHCGTRFRNFTSQDIRDLFIYLFEIQRTYLKTKTKKTVNTK